MRTIEVELDGISAFLFGQLAIVCCVDGSFIVRLFKHTAANKRRRMNLPGALGRVGLGGGRGDALA